MEPNEPNNELSNGSAEKGEVVVDAPGGVAVSLLPEGAMETSDCLLELGTIAGQRRGRIWQLGRKEIGSIATIEPLNIAPAMLLDGRGALA